MVENLDASEPTGPEPGPRPGGDFPFDVPAQSSESKPGAPPSPSPEAPHPVVADRSAHTASDSFPATPAPFPSGEPSKHSVFPIVMGAAFLALVVIAWVKNGQPASAPGASVSKTPALPPEPSAKESAVTALKGELDGITKQLKGLQEKVEALSKPAPPLDLGSLNAKIAGLAKSVDAVAPLPQKVSALDAKAGDIDKSLKALQDGLAGLNAQIVALKGDLKKYGGSATSADKPVDVNVVGQAMSRAVELFKAGRYKEAGDVFKTVVDNDPKDARVWYYAAMSRGMATNDWRGETERLVKKGVEREKAGTPQGAEIDAEFAKLAPPTLKSWLEFYRKTAQ